jgi:hypothetical protein
MAALRAALPTTKPPSSSHTTIGVYLSPRSLLSTEELKVKEEGEAGMMEEIDTREYDDPNEIPTFTGFTVDI